MSTKQLYEKTSEGMKEVSPLVSIEDIYSKLSDTPLEALVSLFNHVKCEWKGSVSDTRRTVPLFLRRSGLFITYNNGTKYITEFFSAGTDQITTEGWVKDSNWTSVPDEDYISAGVKPGVGTIGYEQLNDNLKQLFREKVNVTNFPDDEDIASVDNMLKLKDREADAAKFQSKGYVILRKNLRLVNGVVKNILTQNMINKPNTIYEIRYDFDLNGMLLVDRNIEFVDNGGSLLNGKIKVKRGCVLTLPNETLINPLYIDGKIEFKNKPVLNDNLEVAISFFTNRRDLFVNNAYKIGIRKFNLCSTIWADLQNGEYVLSCDPNKHESEFVLDIDTYLDYIEDRVLDVTEIKLHQKFPEEFYRSNEQIYIDLRTYVKECIDKIYNRKELGIKRLSVFNEQIHLSSMYQSDTEVIIAKKLISEITEYGKSKGILISISYADEINFATRYIPDNVTNFEPTVNLYPLISFSRLNSIPVSNIFEKAESVNNFDRIKYISEIGTTSREKSLASPEAYKDLGDDDYTGTIQYVFWSSVLNSQFIQKMEHVSMWYAEVWKPNDITKIKVLINKYKYGK